RARAGERRVRVAVARDPTAPRAGDRNGGGVMSDEAKSPPFLLWLDIETTGLDPTRDAILEIAWILTEFSYPYRDVDLPGARGTRLLPRPGNDYARELSAFIFDMHTKSGLIEALA